MHTYGVDALVGAKFAINDKAALRVDGVWDWLANEDWKSYKSVRVGLSLYRQPQAGDPHGHGRHAGAPAGRDSRRDS